MLSLAWSNTIYKTALSILANVASTYVRKYSTLRSLDLSVTQRVRLDFGGHNSLDQNMSTLASLYVPINHHAAIPIHIASLMSQFPSKKNFYKRDSSVSNIKSTKKSIISSKFQQQQFLILKQNVLGTRTS